ncbi:hypothetical protein L0F63_000258 [Massospora cicadina]|nr:hypothetical protein L0F63_000258 [Massospora cicadina]
MDWTSQSARICLLASGAKYGNLFPYASVAIIEMATATLVVHLTGLLSYLSPIHLHHESMEGFAIYGANPTLQFVDFPHKMI